MKQLKEMSPINFTIFKYAKIVSVDVDCSEIIQFI